MIMLYEIKIDEVYCSDLILYCVYGRVDFVWLVDILVDCEDRLFFLWISIMFNFLEFVYICSKIKEYVMLESSLNYGW